MLTVTKKKSSPIISRTEIQHVLPQPSPEDPERRSLNRSSPGENQGENHALAKRVFQKTYPTGFFKTSWRERRSAPTPTAKNFPDTLPPILWAVSGFCCLKRQQLNPDDERETGRAKIVPRTRRSAKEV
jgi:hypothetical protein